MGLMRAWMTAAAAALVLAGSGPSDDAQQLTQALRARSAAGAEEALRALVKADSAAAAKAIVGALAQVPSDDPTLYWLVIEAIASLKAEAALAEVGATLSRYAQQPFVRDVLVSLQNNGSAYVTAALGPMLDKKSPEDCQLMAAEFLADVPTPAAVEALIARLEQLKSPSALKQRIVQSLGQLSGKTLGEDGAAWRAWWKVNRDTAKLGTGPGGVKRDPTGTAVDTLPPGAAELERLRKQSTIVVVVSDCPMAGKKGAHAVGDHDLDHMQEILQRMQLPFIEVKKSEFEAFDPTGRTALLVNCNMWRRLCHGEKCGGTKASGKRTVACAGPGPHLGADNRFSKKSIEKIKAYVEKDGGYLFTEDWVLPELLEQAWPEKVREGEYLKELSAPVTAGAGAASHPYLRRIFLRRKPGADPLATTTAADFQPVKHTWAIDADSPSIRVADPAGVVKLMVSPEVGKASAPANAPKGKSPAPLVLVCETCKAEMTVAAYDPSQTVRHTGCGGKFMPAAAGPKKPPAPAGGDDACAVTFFPGAAPRTVVATGGFVQDRSQMKGGGRVVHVLSHFGKQQSEQDEFTLQNLLLNFLIEANERRRPPARK
jgi:hypothetical protein